MTNRLLVIACHGCFIMFLMIIFPMNYCFAEQKPSLEERISTLEKKVSLLEKILDAKLEELASKKPKTTGSQLSVPKGSWKVLAANLRKGMTKAEVRALMGEPDRVSGRSGNIWWYGLPFGGRIDFSPAGEVISWIDPHW